MQVDIMQAYLDHYNDVIRLGDQVTIDEAAYVRWRRWMGYPVPNDQYLKSPLELVEIKSGGDFSPSLRLYEEVYILRSKGNLPMLYVVPSQFIKTGKVK